MKLAILFCTVLFIIGLVVKCNRPKREPQDTTFSVSAVYLHSKKDVTIARQNDGDPDVIFYHMGKDDGIPIEELHIKTDQPLDKPITVEQLCYNATPGHYVQDITIHIHSIYDINFVK